MSVHTVYLELGDGRRRALVIQVPEVCWHQETWQMEHIKPIARVDIDPVE